MQCENCYWRLGKEWPVLCSDRTIGEDVAGDNLEDRNVHNAFVDLAKEISRQNAESVS